LFALPATSTAEDWPRWRGVRADGSWRGPDVAANWPKEGLKTVWKQPVGGGYSGVTVADGRVYVQDRPAGEAQVERVVCFDAADGSPVFEHSYPAPYDDEKRGKLDYRSGPRAAPTVHDGKVFTLGAVGELCCL